MEDPLVEYVEREYRKGFSLEKIRTALVASGYGLTDVEEAIDHMFRRRTHHHILLFGTLAVIIAGLMILQAWETADDSALAPVLEEPISLSESSMVWRRTMAKVPVPRSREECYEYVAEIERLACLEKYGALSGAYYPGSSG